MKRLEPPFEIGRVFGKYTVMSKELPEDGRIFHLCKCECGREVLVTRDNLRNERATGCRECRYPKKVRRG